jgi:hypothetical protein
VSKRKAVPENRKRKPYRPPTLTKLTPEEAKSMIEAKGIPGDQKTKELLKEINRQLENKPR